MIRFLLAAALMLMLIDAPSRMAANDVAEAKPAASVTRVELIRHCYGAYQRQTDIAHCLAAGVV
jgi:hypothetical protein